MNRGADRGGIILVGLRRGALEAAARLGIPVTLLHDEALPAALRRQVDHAVQCDFADPERAVLAARGVSAPSHILAMTERSVVPAARIREALGRGGTDPEIALQCHDKARMKRTLRDAGVRVTDWREIDVDADPEALIAELGLPLVVKPRTSSGSRGLVLAQSVAETRGALRPHHLAERFVHGVEMSVESLRAHGETLFTNCTTYHAPLTANLLPAELDAATRAAVLDLNERALDALGVQRGICHLELFLESAGPVVGEVAIRPPGGYLMRLIELAYGFDPWEALLRVVVRDERPELPRLATACAGACILHPGPGRVRAVLGRAAVRAWQETVELSVRVRKGSQIGPRTGSGEECGHVLLRSTDRNELVRRLDQVPKELRIELEPRRRDGVDRDVLS